MRVNCIILSVLFFIHYGCTGQKEKQELKTMAVVDEKPKTEIKAKNFIKSLQELRFIKDSTKTYTQTKQEISKLKVQLKNKGIPKDSLAIIFKQSLVHKIIPFWEGTQWTFEGHTSIPQRGEIACGYFVSTTLKHIGVNLNRYKLAQQSPINEAYSLALGMQVIEVEECSVEERSDKIKEIIPNGIHFIGFDNYHVGYVFKEDEDLYIIHSNYTRNVCVEIEKFEESDVISEYGKFYIVELSTNEVFLNNWINGGEVKIITTY